MEKKFIAAWNAFCEYYQGKRRLEETLKQKLQSNLVGPYFREEADLVFHFARFLLDVFGDGMVHLNSPITKFYFSNYTGKKAYVDIDISDPKIFMTKNVSRQIFAEFKWIWRGIKKARSTYFTDIMANIEKDLEKLKCLKNLGICQKAFMCIVDEEPQLSQIQNKKQCWEKKYSVKVLLCTYTDVGCSCLNRLNDTLLFHPCQ
ncbi:MAG: hypothetical protein QXF59_06180 [Candidatus Bathyarchaeia archaeon]